MKITNISSYNIALINGKVIKPFESIFLYDTNEELIKQLRSLEKNEIVSVDR